MSVNFRPVTGSQVKILVQPIEAETKTASGIIIPDSAKEKPQEGTIIAVGNNTTEEIAFVKVGDKVLYGKYSGTELKIENIEYMIMKESDLFGIID
ncbi:MAG: co-chaperone GroES [Chryseobacterium sp.]|nr:co-chaperone GroES [Chryseobacterium sp.]